MSIIDFPFLLAFVLTARMEMQAPQVVAMYSTEKACIEAAKARNKEAELQTEAARGVGAAYMCYFLIDGV